MRPLEPADPRALGQYRLLGRLGAGGMGQVFLGRTPDGRTVTLKLIHQHFAQEPEFRRRFRQEVAAAQRVAGEWTAPVLDSDTEAETPWLATGFVPGPPLSRVVDELHGPLPEFSVWRLAEGLARALTAIHAAGVTHRDLKPSNVLLTLDGPRVIDFGIARAADSSVATRTGVTVGSPGYMAPEQVRGERSTEAADVFGLGAVLGYAATGRGPFGTGDSAAHALMFRVVTEPPELGDMTGPLRALAERCLAKEPGERPTPAEIVAEAAGHQDPGAAEGVWLPPALTARLGKEAAELLDLEGPAPAPAAVVSGPAPHHAPTMTAAVGSTPPPPPAHPHPTHPQSGSRPTYVPPPVPAGGAGRNRAVVAGAALAVVGVAALVFALGNGGGEGGDDTEAGGNGGTGQPEEQQSPSTAPDEPAESDQPEDGADGGTETEQPADDAGGFDFSGTWAGRVDHNNTTFEAVVDYTGGDIGEQVAVVDYPDLECGGHWTLRARTDNSVDVIEHITYGSCLDQVPVTLTAVDQVTVQYFVESIGFSTDATGELYRD
ncbi:serine/threonine-protein kinase [Streptomyces litchfieldiae]|uniref:Serine/threonine-protein kinase n=1 Tax=Streptomyces litchfieldiae TaxID=3075543 RepID=A0ABU2MKB6_9ACTN|nr:serine/threonine-protein kinase [Streptomyces sp. DSM 44938]MDT0341965.1 serine/threonine-protein kinase [Streptomyces sp. DSM 44938]